MEFVKNISLVIVIAVGMIAIYQFFFIKQISSQDIVLHAAWNSFIIREQREIRPGETLEGSLNPSTWLELSLRNRGSVAAEHLVVRTSGNEATKGEPSSFFKDGELQKPAYLQTFLPGSRTQE